MTDPTPAILAELERADRHLLNKLDYEAIPRDLQHLSPLRPLPLAVVHHPKFSTPKARANAARREAS